MTGGTGFVGSHLVEALHGRGHKEVRCLVRSAPGWLEGLPHQPVRGDLQDVGLLKEALTGCSTVYHVAGRTRARTWQEYERANVAGTLNLLDAARTLSPSPRVLIVSSLAAVGHSDQPEADEATPLKPVSMYGKSKAEMEQRIQPYHRDLRVTVVRPPAVYGPRDADIFTVFKAAARGVFAVVGGSEGPAFTLVHVRDLVQGMIQAAETAVTVGRTYFLGHDPAYSWSRVRDTMSAALGRRVMTLRIPRPLIVPVGTLSQWAGRLVGAYPPLNREKAVEIRDACIRCSSAAATSDFGYAPSVDLAEGFRETVSWYRDAGWLPAR